MAGYKGWSGGHDVNWDDVESGSPTPLERGVYSARVEKAECKETKDGQPTIEVVLEVNEKYDSDDDVKRSVYDNFTMTEKALFKTKQFCEASDIEPPASTRYEDVSEFAEEIVDTEVWVLLGERTYEGRTRNRIEFYIHDDDVEEVHDRESGDPSGGGRRGRKRSKKKDEAEAKPKKSRKRKAKSKAKDEDDDSDDGDDDAPEDKPKGGRRRRRASSKSNGKAETKGDDGTEDIDDDKDDDEEEEKPRRARRRRRSQAEQG